MKGRGEAVLQVGNTYLFRPNLNTGAQPGYLDEGEPEPGAVPQPGVVGKSDPEAVVASGPGAVVEPGPGTDDEPRSPVTLNPPGFDLEEKSPVSAYNLQASVQVLNSSFILTACQR